MRGGCKRSNFVRVSCMAAAAAVKVRAARRYCMAAMRAAMLLMLPRVAVAASKCF
jgi:hypothetical protein